MDTEGDCLGLGDWLPPHITLSPFLTSLPSAVAVATAFDVRATVAAFPLLHHVHD